MTAETITPRPTRKPVSKRMRFEIFKRDRFTCAYCGRSADEVALALDHVVSHAAGGPDDMTNLVTACVDCNGGKSDVPLGDVAPAISADAVQAMRERVELMRAYQSWRAELDRHVHDLMADAWRAWCEEFDGVIEKADGGERYRDPRVSFPTDNTLASIIEQLPIEDVLDAIRVAAWRWRKRGEEPIASSGVVRYFIGVCNNKMLLRDEQRRNLTVTFDELLSLSPELARIHDEVRDFTPADPWRFCGTRLWRDGWTESLDGRVRQVPAPTERVRAVIGPRGQHARHPVLGSQTALDVAIHQLKADVPLCGQACDCGRPKRPARVEDRPRCPWCEAEIEPVDRREGCTGSIVTHQGVTFASTAYGLEARYLRSLIADPAGSSYRRYDIPRELLVPDRCRSCRAPRFEEHHAGCTEMSCHVCGAAPSEGCRSRGHLAPDLPVSGAMAMARLRMMKPREPWRWAVSD